MRDEPLRTSTWEANVFLSVAETIVSIKYCHVVQYLVFSLIYYINGD